MKLRFLIFVLFLASIDFVVAERGNRVVQFAGQTIDEMIGEFMKEQSIPGMTLSIVQAPYVSRIVGYGVADVERGLLASPKTLWAIGDMTQAYTAVAIMQLVEAGKLQLTDMIGLYLPDLPKEWQAVTVQQLMEHASGVPNYMQQPGFNATKDYSPNEVINLIREQPLVFVPGTRVSRSATNFFLLGLIIEKISGSSYETFITEGQIKPLGLKSTMFASRLSQVEQDAIGKENNKHSEFLTKPSQIDPIEMATGYVEKEGQLTSVPLSNQNALFANGAILSSATDISLWDIGLAGSILLKDPKSRAFIYNNVKLDNGMEVAANCGWRFTGHKGFMDITGNSPGFSVYLSRFTDKSELVCVTLCANKEGVDLTELARRIAGCFDVRLGPPANPEVMTCYESSFPVDVTVDRLEAYLKEKGIAVAVRINHAAAAKKVGLELRPTETLVFGNPAVGTHLMLSQQNIAVDLPLRVAVWQDANGRVWLGYDNISAVAKRHQVIGQEDVITKMERGLQAAALHSTSPY